MELKEVSVSKRHERRVSRLAEDFVIEMLHITKEFPGIKANDDITLQLRKGEVHALLGENGAGKSTLMSVLFGLYQPEAGQIRKNGKEVVIRNPNDANALGIGMVHQHFKLVECFSVLDNIILGVEPNKMGFLQKAEARKKVMALSEKYGLRVDPDALISDISVGMQQRVEILKMLYRDNEILIFDEPTAVLTPQEIDELMEIMRGFKKEGKSILFEAQLGALRDLDYGIYPYTTSSNVIGAYAPIGAGIPGHKLTNSIGVMKAYSSCVGDGPFAAELAMTEEEKHDLREAGHEYGAATGRPRRVGPIDLVASRYGVFCQGCDEVALTLLDVLDYMEKIPMVTAYKLTDGTPTTRFPMGEALDTAQPVVEYLPGWHCDITAARKWEDLPKEARDYVEYLEKAVGCKITYISVGAEREAYIHHVV